MRHASRFLAGLLAVVALAGSAHGQIPELRIWGPADVRADDALAFERVRDVTYFKGLKADFFRHRLDVYVPKDKKQFPTVVLVHGGAWTIGDNRCAGLYTTVGEFLASRGIGVVMPNYRLSPWVKHPEHIKDVVRAVAWTKANIGQHGGDAGQLFLAGHSAGGHLAALMGTDAAHLKAAGLLPEDVRGVIGISGVYKIPEVDVKVVMDVRPDQLFPLRGSATDAAPVKLLFTVPLSVDVYATVFGRDANVRANASPINHVRPGLPAFLLLTAENELPTLDAMAEDFQRALLAKGNDAEHVRVAKRNHSSVMFSAIQIDDPVARRIVGFVKKHSR